MRLVDHARLSVDEDIVELAAVQVTHRADVLGDFILTNVNPD